MIWSIKKFFYRIPSMAVDALLHMLKVPEAKLLEGPGSIRKLAGEIKKRGISSVLIVTGRSAVKFGLVNGLVEDLKRESISYTFFSKVHPDPSIQNVEDALQVYKENNCRAIVGFGGGSPLDCAKIVAARVINKKDVSKMRGVFRLNRIKKLPPFFLVPTTAGSGSEATVAAIISNPETHEKLVISDFKLVPQIAVIDGELMLGLPPRVTADTGMDALTHAVEAYISRSRTKKTDENVEKAVKIIFGSLVKAYNKGSDIVARHELAMASYYAGRAFTRAYIGYVHAIAHAVGGLYGVAHGRANAIILPYILDYYGKSIYHRLAKLAIITEIGTENEKIEVLAKRFIQQIRTMNEKLNIPETIKEIKEEDINRIAKRVLREGNAVLMEGNPGYPVPKIMNFDECKDIVEKLIYRA